MRGLRLGLGVAAEVTPGNSIQGFVSLARKHISNLALPNRPGQTDHNHPFV